MLHNGFGLWLSRMASLITELFYLIISSLFYFNFFPAICGPSSDENAISAAGRGGRDI
jgi:hypothetical protein